MRYFSRHVVMMEVRKGWVKGFLPECVATTRIRPFRPFVRAAIELPGSTDKCEAAPAASERGLEAGETSTRRQSPLIFCVIYAIIKL